MSNKKPSKQLNVYNVLLTHLKNLEQSPGTGVRSFEGSHTLVIGALVVLLVHEEPVHGKFGWFILLQVTRLAGKQSRDKESNKKLFGHWNISNWLFIHR